MLNMLKKKFILINMLFVCVILIAAFCAIVLSTYYRIEENSRRALEQYFIKDEPLEPPAKKIGAPREGAYGRQPMNSVVFTVKLDENNKIKELIGQNIEISDDVLEKIVAECLEGGKQGGVLWDTSLRYLLKDNRADREIIFYDLTDDISMMLHLIKNCLIVGIISLFAFLMISIYLAKWALKPVEASWDQQKQFIADVSHELKTPLTVILANADILESHKEDTIKQQYKWLEYIKAEASYMSGLVNDLLFLAKADAKREKAVLSDVNLSDIMWNCYLPFESVAFEQEKQLEADIEPDILIKGDSGKLKQLIMILLDNACKYTEKNGKINVRLYTKPERDRAYIIVNNTSEPIEQENLEHLFERFYRTDESRAREKGGYGLGLAIAKTITDMHFGKISVSSNKEEGTTFKVTLNAKI